VEHRRFETQVVVDTVVGSWVERRGSWRGRGTAVHKYRPWFFVSALIWGRRCAPARLMHYSEMLAPGTAGGSGTGSVSLVGFGTVIY